MSSTLSPPRRRRWPVLVVLALAAAGAAWAVPWLAYRFTHSISKDAFVESHLVNVAPQVAGTVVAMFVQEQDRVARGQLLAQVDPTPYQREVNLAAARLAVAEAVLHRAEADLALVTAEVPKRVTIAEMKEAIAREDEARAVAALDMVRRDVDQAVAAARSAVAGARASLVLADEDYHRYAALYRDGSATERRFQEATRTHRTAQAEVQVAEARLGQAEANRKQVAIAEQQLRAARHGIAEARAAVELARLGTLQIEAARQLVAERSRGVAEARRALEVAQTNLDYTRITAPQDGVIAKKWRHLGDYAHTGDPVFTVYDPDLLYVTVHLEETLLEGVAPGNEAVLHIEAYRQPFRGRVLWVGSATGANFSLIPRDLSSGEFTYVVQRVPTRIAIARDERWSLLKPGLSVTAAIAHGPGDPAWAREALRREAEIGGIRGEQP